MNLILEIVKAPSEYNIMKRSMHFDEKGGKVGRSPNATWVLEDHTKHISNYHVEISFNSGKYYITDISSNGTFFKEPYKKLVHSIPMPLVQGSIVSIGMYDIAVSSIESSFIKGTATNINDNRFLPDDMFTDNATSDALDILKVETHEASDILSLLGDSTEKDNHHILPDLGVILDLEDDHENNIVTPESLSMHIDLGQEEEEEEEPSNKLGITDNDDLIDILTSKLGINLRSKTKEEQKIFISDLADIVSLVLDQSNNIAQNINAINQAMGATLTVDYSILSLKRSALFNGNGNLNEGLLPALQNFYNALSMQQKGLQDAYNNSFSELTEQFSPDRLYMRFKNEGKLNKTLLNKDAQAWGAYTQEFQYLNNSRQGKEILSEVFRQQYNKGFI